MKRIYIPFLHVFLPASQFNLGTWRCVSNPFVVASHLQSGLWSQIDKGSSCWHQEKWACWIKLYGDRYWGVYHSISFVYQETQSSTQHHTIGKRLLQPCPLYVVSFLWYPECCITSETSDNIYHFELWSRKNGDQQSGSTCHALAVRESCMDLRWTQIQICSLKTVALVTDKIFWDISSCITWMRVLCLWKRNAWLLLGLLVVMRWESYELELRMLWLCLTACVLLNALHKEIEIHYVSLA